MTADLALRDRLFASVAQALRALLGPGELRATVGEALRCVGEAGAMHRVKVILPVAGSAPPAHALVHEWAAPGWPTQASLGVVDFPDAAIEAYLGPMRRGESLWQLIDEVPAHLAEPFRRVGMQSMGVVPILSAGCYAGLVAFDDCATRRRWSSAEIDALTIAAQGIGAAIEREAERNRIARDMHDTIAQGFGAISMGLQAALRTPEPERRTQLVEQALRDARACLADSRATLALLRGLQEPLTDATLEQTLHRAVAGRLAGSGLAWQVRTTGTELPALAAAAIPHELWHIVREAASNALRHGRASRFDVELAGHAGGWTLTLADDGGGFDVAAAPEGFGLLGMQERAHRLGATLQVDSKPGGPTVIRVRSGGG